MVASARVWPARNAIVLVPVGRAFPGKHVRVPAEAGWVTVTFAEIVLAFAGTPQVPARTKVRRAPLPTSAGPPCGPFGFRVSRIRHGVTGKNRDGAGGGA